MLEFSRNISCNVSILLQGQILRFILSAESVTHDLVLLAIMSLQSYLVRSQILISGRMLNDQRNICLYYTSSSFKPIVRVNKLNSPKSIISFVTMHTHFLFPWFAWIGSCAHWDTVKIQSFLIEVVISSDLYFLPVMHEIIRVLVVLIRRSLDHKHGPSTRANVLISSIDNKGFVIWKNLRSNINNQESTCLFIEQHNLISKSKFTVLWECLGNLPLDLILPFYTQNWIHPMSY